MKKDLSMMQPIEAEKRPDPEVDAKPARRRFTAAYKLRILTEADAAREAGQVGELLRREGLYSSHLTTWRAQREAGALAAPGPERGRKAKVRDREKERLEQENVRLRRENQRERMDYAHYQELGLPIGSGVVEAACKTLAAQRLKLSGMSWGDGVQGILTIRSLQQSGRWERAWPLLASAFRVDIYQVQDHGQVRTICRYEKAS